MVLINLKLFHDIVFEKTNGLNHPVIRKNKWIIENPLQKISLSAEKHKQILLCIVFDEKFCTSSIKMFYHFLRFAIFKIRKLGGTDPWWLAGTKELNFMKRKALMAPGYHNFSRQS